MGIISKGLTEDSVQFLFFLQWEKDVKGAGRGSLEKSLDSRGVDFWC